MGDTEEQVEERWAILAKMGFERRLRFHDDEMDSDGTKEEFEVLCEALEVCNACNDHYYFPKQDTYRVCNQVW